MSVVQAVHVEGRREETRAFHGVPARLYRNRWPAWTPLPAGEEARLFDRARNPSLAETEHARWVALHDARPVGRVSALTVPTRTG